MILIGMIYQYDETQGTGHIMFSDGEQEEFTKNDWIDTIDLPSVGQKVSYQSDGNNIKIKTASEEDIIKAWTDKKNEESIEEKSLEDYLNYYTDMGFNLVKDDQDGESRILTLRSFTAEEYSEAIIKQIASKITVTQTVNGKPLTLNV